MTRKSNMINKILKGWLNINKLVKIFIYDWHNCTSTAHVAQRGIFAHPCFIHCHRFSHFSLRFASSSTFSFPPDSIFQESKNGGQKRVEQSTNQRPPGSNPIRLLRLRRNPRARDNRQNLPSSAQVKVPSAVLVPSSHLHASPLVRRNCLDRLGFV